MVDDGREGENVLGYQSRSELRKLRKAHVSAVQRTGPYFTVGVVLGHCIEPNSQSLVTCLPRPVSFSTLPLYLIPITNREQL